MTIKIIKTKREYEAACKRIDELIHTSEVAIDPGTKEGDELELLSLLVENYEREHFPVDAPDPIEAIRFRMEQMGLRQKDIAALFGGKTRISEVLNRKRPLSMKMIILLNRYLGIPLESLIHGSSVVKLKASDKKELLEIPSIKEFINRSPDKRVPA